MAGSTEYHHGEMNIDEQARTFSGFMRTTVWGCALLAVLLTFLTLHYTFVGLDWFVSLGISIVLGVVIGLLLGLKGAWYATLIGLAVLGGVIGVAGVLVGMLTGG